MNIKEFQQWLNAKGQGLVVDGAGGPKTRAAIMAVFTNKNAPRAEEEDFRTCAEELGCTLQQMHAIAKVESRGSGFDKLGRPKILFERHKFWHATRGRFGVSDWSNPKSGGYDHDSWDKLCRAACQDPMAAFGSASWGAFQIMGNNAVALGYSNPLAMAYVMTQSEADQIEAFERFIKANELDDEVRAISVFPETNIPFARGFNGKNYAKLGYHIRIAEAMR